VKVEVRGQGRPLLYLHPAGGARWTKALEKLAQTHTVHMPTFPGFDGTPIDPEVTARRALGRLLGDYIEREVGQACDIMGCSFGGAVALWLAIERPQCVDHLVLECPGGLQSIDPALRRDPQDEVEAQNRRMLAHYGAEDGKDERLLQELDRVQAVTLILHGTEDRIIAAESMRLLKGRLARAFLVYVWDAAHHIEVDQPERLAAVVQSFLERSDAFVVRYA